MSETPYRFVRVLAENELAEGRVTTVTVEHLSIALTHFGEQWAALANACPHQGGPLGEGSIECGAEGRSWLRCPWHGWDFDPLTGKSPGGFGDGLTTYPVEIRDGEVFVGVPESEFDDEHERTIGDVLAESLVAWDLRVVFGMVGHSNLGMADALRRRVEAGELRYVGIRHEGAAAFAASAYGKLTGRPAGCLTIAGPGATNLLTGMYDAKVDRAPLIALTGQVDTQVLGPGAFQELDLQAVFADVSAFDKTVLPGSRAGELVSLAMKNALLRQQPVNLVLPDEVQVEAAGDDQPVGRPEGRMPAQRVAPDEGDLDRAVQRLREAKRPLIVLGHGARFDTEACIALAETLGAPVCTTFKGKGLIADAHPLGCGVLGRSGTPIASWFMNECDLILAIGASFSNHTGITPKKPIVQIDLDPMQVGKFHAVEIGLFGQIARTVGLMREALAGAPAVDLREEVAERWRIWRAEKQRRLSEERGQGVSSSAVFDAMNRVVQEDAILAVDVGNNTYSFGRYFEASGRQSVLMSGYLGSIGFGYPAAMGAWAATQESDPAFAGRPVWCVSGDGGFAQYMMEVMTAVKYGMDITHVLLHNDELGKISKEQRAGRFDVWETSLHNCDFRRYAENCGALGIRVEAAGELEEALVRARDHCGPALVEVMTDVALV